MTNGGTRVSSEAGTGKWMEGRPLGPASGPQVPMIGSGGRAEMRTDEEAEHGPDGRLGGQSGRFGMCQEKRERSH